jgi:tetratricopeptide (TPR) repeat protein
MHALTRSLLVAFVSLILASTAQLQPVFTTPRVSPAAGVTQRIGITDVTINYHRPAVKERTVWGELVPNGLAPSTFGNQKPMPWRAGANENTTITFAHDVRVEGQTLAAGTYGLHMIPSEAEWTIIFSKNTTSWGSFFYEESEDVLRVTVTPVADPPQEWLEYDFEELTKTSAVAYLSWAGKKVPFKIEVDTDALVVQQMRNELRSVAGFGAQGYRQAASYCLANNINHDEALSWIDTAIQRNPDFQSRIVKAQLLAQIGNQTEADKIEKEALDGGNEVAINLYGYQLMGNQNLAKAIEIFKLNAKRYPDSWNVYDSLGEAYSNNSETEKAIKNYKTALSKAPENQKERIKGILAKLESTN